jgi:hypothetical protein
MIFFGKRINENFNAIYWIKIVKEKKKKKKKIKESSMLVNEYLLFF